CRNGSGVQREARVARGGGHSVVRSVSRCGAVHARCHTGGSGGRRLGGGLRNTSAVTESVLAPLAARYAAWLTRPAGEVAALEDDPTLVWVMPVVFRLERGGRPVRREILEGAATAIVDGVYGPARRTGRRLAWVLERQRPRSVTRR